MSEPQLYTEEQLIQTAKEKFGACLIVSSASFFLYGFTVSQFVKYVTKFWKRDKVLTRIWVILVMAFNTASVLYGGVYADWLLSISSWGSSYAKQNDQANGVSSILYGFTVTLVQLFWTGCIWRMMAAQPTLRWFCCILISLVSLGSLSIAIALGQYLINETSDGISEAHSRLSRGIDGLSLLADIIILIVIFANMLVIRRSSKSLKRSISRLTFIFAAVTLISSLLLIAEIVIIYPSTTQSRYIIDFTYFYAPTYTFSMLAILNARYSFYSRQNGAFSSQRHDTEKVEPQMNFTVMTNHSTVLASEKGSEQVQEDKSYCETRTEPARLHLDNVAQLGRESPTIGIETCP